MLVADNEVAEGQSDEVFVGGFLVVDGVVAEGAAVAEGCVEGVDEDLGAAEVFLVEVGACD